MSHPDVNPFAVYARNQPGNANGVDANGRPTLEVSRPHAVGVAGIMIANGTANRGVAPDAKLHSSAVMFGENQPSYFNTLVSMQHVAKQNGDQVPVINMSMGLPPRPAEGAPLNGLSGVSQGLDYLARQRDVLFVLSKGNTDAGGGDIPKDSYNGLVVGGLDYNGGKYDQVHRRTDTNPDANGRRLIHVVAPAVVNKVPRPTANGNGEYVQLVPGTSLAAPHVTGTVALLEEYARGQVAALGLEAQRHEVMKAVVMNSADKVKDRLGMTKDVVRTDGKTWDKSDAADVATNPRGRSTPLDDQMGTGAVNARRARDQLKGGRFGPQVAGTKEIGWDYNTAPAAATPFADQKYTLPRLKGGSYLAATLVWDRIVDLDNDGGTPGEYDPPSGTNPAGDSFKVTDLADMDLYLMRGNETDISKAVWASTSNNYNVEHFFFKLPADDTYSLWVRNRSTRATKYALAWWGEAAPADGPGSIRIGDRVWDDLNANGSQDLGSEPGRSGVRVRLFRNSDNLLVDTRYTGADGGFQFVAPSAAYYLVVDAPFGSQFTDPNDVADDTADSDVDAAGRSPVISVPSVPGVDLTVDAGLVPVTATASVGNRVWRDTVPNGLQDAGELGVAGVVVRLYTSADQFVAETVTDANGVYTFSGLPAGQYFVIFSPDSFSTFAARDAGSDTVDSDADASGRTALFTLVAGQVRTDVDAGLQQPTAGGVGDLAWDDSDRDGIQDAGEPGLGGVAVDLYTSAGVLVEQAVTDPAGYYQFWNVPAGNYYLAFTPPDGYALGLKDRGADDAKDSDADPATGRTAVFAVAGGATRADLDAGLTSGASAGASVGDVVWNDSDRDGVRDAGETGLAGVTVRLLDSGGAAIRTTYTSGTGLYLFAGLGAGTYRVEFVLPSGYTFSPKDQGGDDARDSDADPATGRTGTFTLTAGQVRADLDAGMSGSGGPGGNIDPG
ncbi:MAG: carboxypeptidase regulatory-like domain-containing protein [Gemmataceae bacterium]|nr:carboxypeptidase regulatory-like domain-containing protein [Gemmataceae bacterium]